jgi:hypothetical protein
MAVIDFLSVQSRDGPKVMQLKRVVILVMRA